MTDDKTNDRDSAPPRAPASKPASVLGRLGPLMFLLMVGWINGLGGWPAFRQQDTNVLHWILTSNSEALKGLNQDLKSDSSDSGNPLRNALKNYLTLENMNLSGQGLSSSDLSYMNLENVNLAGAQLVNSNFSCTDLTRVDFSGAKLINSKFDFSGCQRHISTNSLRCRRNMLKIIQEPVNDTKWPFGRPEKFTCLEATFIGADFSGAQIRGDQGRRSLYSDNKYCKNLLVLVGNMSGATFNEANLTCVALIHQPVSPGNGKKEISKDADLPPSQGGKALPRKATLYPAATPKPISGNANKKQNTGDQPMYFSFNGISFADARLDRVALLSGPFRFTQFERAKLMGLFLNISAGKADIDYSRFNEISCIETSRAMDNHKDKPKDKSKTNPKYLPCLLVQRDKGFPAPLQLNLLWSTLVTNLEPSEKDSFLCTPTQDLPAWVEGKRIESADYWLSTKSTKSTKPTKMKPSDGLELELLDCPALDDQDPKKRHHVLQPKSREVRRKS